MPDTDRPAGRDFSSYLVRDWRMCASERRLDVEHIQPGRCVRVESLAAAVEWMSAHVGATPATAVLEPGTEQRR